MMSTHQNVCLLMAAVILFSFNYLIIYSMRRYVSLEFVGSSKTNSRELLSKGKHQARRRVTSVSCSKIIEGDKTEIERAKTIMKSTDVQKIPDSEFVTLTSDCQQFLDKFNYVYGRYGGGNSGEEFPIAFSILMHESVEQAERLLRAIYRPQNVYCIHVDKSASRDVKDGIRSIVKCFQNVFLVSRSIDVVYGHFSRLQAELNCMNDLLNKSAAWKYLINLPSTEFPLKTNEEIVKILKIYNGSNDIEGITHPKKIYYSRFMYSHVLSENKLKHIPKRKSSPPHNISMVKGSAYGVFSRDFLNFVTTDQRALDFLNWTRDIQSPDEYFWATMNHNKHLNAPGQYTGKPDDKPWLATYAAWSGRDRCHGKFRNFVCVFGIEDLNELVSRKELFANKFHTHFEPLTLDCLEEWLLNKTSSPVPFESFYYRQLPFVHT